MTTVFANTYISGLIDEITMASGSIQFNGSTDYLTLSNTPFNFGTNSFTVDFWHYYVAGNSTYNTFFDNGSQGVFLSFDTSTKLLFYGVPAQGSATGYAHGMAVNTWNHIAFVRNGTTLTIYVNGNSIGSWTGITGSMSGSGATAYIGEYSGGGAYYINGNISNFRVVNGRALYTSNFIPEPSPSLPVANTSLLLSVQPNNPFQDTSNNNLTITKTGTPTFNNVGPFNPAPPSTGTSQNIPMKYLQDGTVMISGYYDECGPNYVTPGSYVYDGLISYLDASVTSSYSGSGTTFTDLSGLGNNGTLVGSPTFNSTSGGNIVLNGSSQYISAPLTKSASMTFSIWATAVNVTQPMLFTAGATSAGPDLFFYAGGIYWNTYDGQGNPFGTIPASATNGSFHNYVVVNDSVANNTKLYYDGSLLGTAAYRSAAVTTRYDIGGDTGYNWQGSIASSMVYNKALSLTEITTNFNSFRSRFGI